LRENDGLVHEHEHRPCESEHEGSVSRIRETEPRPGPVLSNAPTATVTVARQHAVLQRTLCLSKPPR